MFIKLLILSTTCLIVGLLIHLYGAYRFLKGWDDNDTEKHMRFALLSVPLSFFGFWGTIVTVILRVFKYIE